MIPGNQFTKDNHETLPKQTPKGLERADCCPQQALVRLVSDSGELLFCGHHYGEHDAMLFANGWAVVEDFRHDVAKLW